MPSDDTPTCRYCGKLCVFSQSSAHIYHGRDYGPVWECSPCNAYCGTHQRGRKALDTPSNRADRHLRKQAHAAFDPLWKRVAKRDGIRTGHARARGYVWLAKELGIDPKDCHIGMMHGDQLRAVITTCTPPYGNGTRATEALPQGDAP